MKTSRLSFENETILLSLYRTFTEAGDALHARQAFNLIKKYQDQRFDVCFCGHFSAGKSSLLNELMYEELLPTSPIPTSANLVSISHGSPQIQIVFWNGDLKTYTPPYDLTAIKQLAKNGEAVSEIRIQTNAGFPPHWGLMDTPGIDSTDPAHQAATEEAVQLSDVIFYVADYNHMQAADNFHFLKSVQALKKPFHIIVTQMDKHNETEISLEDYKHKVMEGLHSWQLYPSSIHYVSIVDQGMPHNDLGQLKQLLFDLQKDSQPVKSVPLPLLEDLIERHKHWWQSRHEDKIQENETKLQDVNKASLQSDYEHLESEMTALNHLKAHWFEDVQAEVVRTIKSAILMPYETREAARSFLEANQSQFKTGLFTTKKKVEAIRSERLQLFYKQLNEHIKILKHQTIDTLTKSIEQLIGKNEEVRNVAQSLSYTIEPADLVKWVHKGASFNSDYVLQYTNDVTEHIKQAIRLSSQELLKALSKRIDEELENKQRRVSHDFNQLKDQYKALNELNTINDQKLNYYDGLDKMLEKEGLLTEDVASELANDISAIQVWTINLLPTSHQQDHLDDIDTDSKELDSTVEESMDTDSQSSTQFEHYDGTNIEKWQHIFQDSAKNLKQVDGFQDIISSLETKAYRLQHQRFTIALFGAFSAGKSSFANALLGKKVLPVSPHPTTATINRILPVDDEHLHETAEIELKKENDILLEINDALKPFKKSITHFDELSPLLEELSDEESERVTFLKAAAAGWAPLVSYFGQTLTVSLKEAQAFISTETKACFVERANLYYDCNLTQQGIILVDTPGADSINARHTEAAFHYIKSADAILYVSYYNHAFSRADEEFLIQLGRVKDAFELDKMFFLVNAIDLAQSEEDLMDVKEYVKDRLLTFGIRNPRLYGVSSKLALLAHEEKDPSEAKILSKHSGMASFYKDWMDYIQNDLKGHLVVQGIKEIEQAKRLIKDILKTASLNEEDRQHLRETIQIEYQQGLNKVDKKYDTYLSRLSADIDEYYLYVKKRVIQRFIDEFTRFFNPAVLQRGQSGSKKAILSQCLEELLEFLSFDLDQENRATFIRVEAKMNQLIKQKQELLTATLEKLSTSWWIPEREKLEWESAPIAASLKDVDKTHFESVFKFYKNPKQFFEGNGQKQFRQALEVELSQVIDQITEENKEKTIQHYQEQWEKQVCEIDAEHQASLMKQCQQKLDALESNQEQMATYTQLLSSLSKHIR